MMINQLEFVHELYDSVETMLSPETLSELTAQPITNVTVKPIGEHNGLSGAQFSYIETDNGRFFMKRMSPDTDYIMKVTDDTQCRQVTLWQHGLLDELHPKVNHGIIAAAKDGDGWALLMHDLTDAMFTEDNLYSDDMFWLYLDRLAYIHATFWNDSRLENHALGLMTPHRFSSCFSVNNVSAMQTYTTTPLHDWITNGWLELKKFVLNDVYLQIRELANDPQSLVDALAQLPSTLVHGDYRSVNFAHNDTTDLTVFDWQFGCYTLMTADLQIPILHRNSQRDAIESTYRVRLQHYLGITFENDEWDRMIALGLCAFSLQRVCFSPYLTTLNDEAYKYFSALIPHTTQWIIDAQKWL